MTQQRQTRKLPKGNELRALLNEMTVSQIAREYGVTPAAVSNALKRAGIEPPSRVYYRDIVDWDVQEEHRQSQMMVHLRALGKRERGVRLTPTEETRLNKWLDQMESSNLILCYDRNKGPNIASNVGGFFYDKRKPGETGPARN